MLIGFINLVTHHMRLGVQKGALKLQLCENSFPLIQNGGKSKREWNTVFSALQEHG